MTPAAAFEFAAAAFLAGAAVALFVFGVPWLLVVAVAVWAGLAWSWGWEELDEQRPRRR